MRPLLGYVERGDSCHGPSIAILAHSDRALYRQKTYLGERLSCESDTGNDPNAQIAVIGRWPTERIGTDPKPTLRVLARGRFPWLAQHITSGLMAFVICRMMPGGHAMRESGKIAAILVSEVVGYSRLAGSDEHRTLARLRALRSDLIDLQSPCITAASSSAPETAASSSSAEHRHRPLERQRRAHNHGQNSDVLR